MSWKLYDRNGQFLGAYEKLEAAMSVLGTGEIGMKWLPLTANEFIGVSNGGATRFVLKKED